MPRRCRLGDSTPVCTPFLVHLRRRLENEEYGWPLEVGDELRDSGERYRVVRVQERETRGGFGHAWAEQEPPRTGDTHVRATL
jgi:hypothetical protein